MPYTHQPRLEVDITAIINVGITPFGIFVVSHIVLDDAHHVLRIQYVGFLKVARSAYFVTYPIPLAATIKKLHVDKGRQAITCRFEQLYRT